MTLRRWVARLRPNQGATSISAAGIMLGLALERYPDRIVELQLSPADARELSACLERWADSCESELRPVWESHVNRVPLDYFPDVWTGKGGA